MSPAPPVALVAALAALGACDVPGPAPLAPAASDTAAVGPAALPPDTVDVRGVQSARAEIEPVGQGRVTGTVALSRIDGGVRVLMDLRGLSRREYHAVQVLRGRDCSADPAVHLGADAGTPHGGPYSLPGARHAGDLGSIRGDGERGRYDRIDTALSLDGTASAVGRAVVVRAARDDAASPGGAAGAVVGCGVLGAD